MYWNSKQVSFHTAHVTYFFMFKTESGGTFMEGFIFGPEAQITHQLSSLLRKCGASVVNGGIQFDALYLKVRREEVDFIFGDNTIFNYERLDNLCRLCKVSNQPILFIYDTELSLKENAEHIMRQYTEHYNCKIPPNLRSMMETLFPILYRDGEWTDAEPTANGQADALQSCAPPQGFAMKMLPAARALYHFLYTHRNQDVTMAQMSCYLWNNAAKSHARTLYGYIYNIRKCLNDIGEQHSLLVRVRQSVYRLNIPEGQEKKYKCFE